MGKFNLYQKTLKSNLAVCILYHNNKRILTIESDIGLKLPKNTIHHIQNEIDLIRGK